MNFGVGERRAKQVVSKRVPKEMGAWAIRGTFPGRIGRVGGPKSPGTRMGLWGINERKFKSILGDCGQPLGAWQLEIRGGEGRLGGPKTSNRDRRVVELTQCRTEGTNPNLC